MAFTSHGDFNFTTEDNLLIIEGTGPWNMEAILSSAEEACDCHKKLYGKPWGALAIIHGDPIHTPDAAQLLTDIVIKDKQNGRIASALVLDKSNHPDFGRHHITDIYNNAGELFDFFETVQEAKKWLRDQFNKS